MPIPPGIERHDQLRLQTGGQLLDLVTACLRHGDRHQPLPQPYVKGDLVLPGTRFGLRRPATTCGSG